MSVTFVYAKHRSAYLNSFHIPAINHLLSRHTAYQKIIRGRALLFTCDPVLQTTVSCIVLYCTEHQIAYSSGDHINENETGGECDRYVGEDKYMHGTGGKT